MPFPSDNTYLVDNDYRWIPRRSFNLRLSINYSSINLSIPTPQISRNFEATKNPDFGGNRRVRRRVGFGGQGPGAERPRVIGITCVCAYGRGQQSPVLRAQLPGDAGDDPA